MKLRILSTAMLTGSALLASAPAYAHPGDHGENVLSMALHWLSSPSHSLFAVIGGLAFAAVAVKLVRKNRA